VIVTDANGAQASANYLLQAPPAMSYATAAVPNTCLLPANGHATVQISGGKAPYSYSWSQGSSGATATGLGSGAYTCTVTDGSGCQVLVTVTVPQGDILSSLTETRDNSCAGENNGAIEAYAAGGYAPYTFTWDHGPVTRELTGLAAGFYTVTIRDSLGCEVQEMTEVREPEPLVIQIEAQTQVLPAPLTGKVQGGIPPYQTGWNTGDSSLNLTATVPGLYVLTVTDAAGCTASGQYHLMGTRDPGDCRIIYTGFTPNGDGVNEVWVLPCAASFPENEVTVFNRWGQEVFSVVNYDNTWDGTVGGYALPDGTYYYMIRLTANDDKRQFEGTVSILR
jgi:gliding motility-associated-like protein